MDGEPIHFSGQIRDKADDFLQRTIGEENYLLFKEKGYLEVKGTNNGIYRITKNGKISKILIIDGFNEFVRKRKKGLILLFAIYLGIMTFIFSLTEGLLRFYSIIAAGLVTMTLLFCSISLYKRKIGYNRTLWKGKINKWDLPIEDGIAVCYMNIKFDSNRFDRDKGCGLIYIQNNRMNIEDLATP